MRRSTRLASWTMGVSLAVLSGGTTVAGAAEPPGAATPEAIYGRFQQAFAAKDMVEISRCLAPEGAAEIIVGLYFGGGMAAAMEAGEDQAKAQAGMDRLDAIMKQHGVELGPDEAGQALQGGAMPPSLLAVADPGALVADLLAFATEMGLENTSGEPPALGELADLQIDGDTARATTSAGPIEFVRQNERWYLGEETMQGLKVGAEE